MKTSTKSSVRAFLLAVPFTWTSLSCTILPPQEDSTRLAVLVSVEELEDVAVPAVPAAPSAVRFGLGPVTLPEYLKRSEIVSRVEGTRLIPSETERWGEPLDRAVVRVLAIDLERSLGAGRVVRHPWFEKDRPDLQIEIDFSRCERDESGRIVVAARWSVRSLDGEAPPIERESRIERESAGPDGASTALALSRALADLCSEIALAWSSRNEAGAGTLQVPRPSLGKLTDSRRSCARSPS